MRIIRTRKINRTKTIIARISLISQWSCQLLTLVLLHNSNWTCTCKHNNKKDFRVNWSKDSKDYLKETWLQERWGPNQQRPKLEVCLKIYRETQWVRWVCSRHKTNFIKRTFNLIQRFQTCVRSVLQPSRVPCKKWQRETIK